jgi:hypothetical protein
MSFPVMFLHNPAYLAALAAHEKTFECKPCWYGHVGRRSVSSGKCMRCAQIRNAARCERKRIELGGKARPGKTIHLIAYPIGREEIK